MLFEDDLNKRKNDDADGDEPDQKRRLTNAFQQVRLFSPPTTLNQATAVQPIHDLFDTTPDRTFYTSNGPTNEGIDELLDTLKGALAMIEGIQISMLKK